MLLSIGVSMALKEGDKCPRALKNGDPCRSTLVWKIGDGEVFERKMTHTYTDRYGSVNVCAFVSKGNYEHLQCCTNHHVISTKWKEIGCRGHNCGKPWTY